MIEGKANLATKILWKLLSPLARSAEKGSWTEVMCATAEGLASARYYGPTRFEMVSPIGECPLEAFVLNQEMATKLWTISEQKTSLIWSL